MQPFHVFWALCDVEGFLYPGTRPCDSSGIFILLKDLKKKKIGTCPCSSSGIFMWKDLDFLHMPLWQLWIFCDVDGSGCLIRTPQTAMEHLWYWWIWVSHAYPSDCYGTLMILMDLGVSCIPLRLLWNIYDVDWSGCLLHTPQTAVEHLWCWRVWISLMFWQLGNVYDVEGSLSLEHSL